MPDDVRRDGTKRPGGVEKRDGLELGKIEADLLEGVAVRRVVEW